MIITTTIIIIIIIIIIVSTIPFPQIRRLRNLPSMVELVSNGAGL